MGTANKALLERGIPDWDTNRGIEKCKQTHRKTHTHTSAHAHTHTHKLMRTQTHAVFGQHPKVC